MTTDLRPLREAYGSQEDAADALGVNARTLRRAEKDPGHPNATLYRLALVGLLTTEGVPVPGVTPPPAVPDATP